MLNPKYKNLSDAEINQFVRTIFQQGYIALSEFLAPETWNRLLAFCADRKIAQKKTQDLNGSIAHDLIFSEEIFSLFNKIYQQRCLLENKPYIPLKKENQVCGFAYKNALEGQKTYETDFHYDGAYVNGVLAIVLPPDPSKDGGHLTLFPNFRKKQAPLISKIFSRILRHSPLARKLYGSTLVPYQEGAMHLFFGDISFHGVAPIKKGERLILSINSHW
jgi:hypothetical protein